MLCRRKTRIWLLYNCLRSLMTDRCCEADLRVQLTRWRDTSWNDEGRSSSRTARASCRAQTGASRHPILGPQGQRMTRQDFNAHSSGRPPALSPVMVVWMGLKYVFHPNTILTHLIQFVTGEYFQVAWC